MRGSVDFPWRTVAYIQPRMNRGAFLSLAMLLCLRPASFGDDIQARADALFRRAQQLSDIRAPGAPAFRLKATFSTRGEGLETVQGTYTELWASESQWRRETVVGDLAYIEIGGPAKEWLLYPEEFPFPASRVRALMQFLPTSPPDLTFDSIEERATSDSVAECLLSKPVPKIGRSALCFDKKSGFLLGRVAPEPRPRNVVSSSCEYGAFQKFGDYFFPREMACFEDRHKTISATVVELSFEPTVNSELYTEPLGAIELDRCVGKTIPPLLSARESMFPRFDPDQTEPLRLWLVIDEKGRPRDLRVRPAGKNYREKAKNALRELTFKPGTCDGKSISMPMSLEIGPPHQK
jgi:hypothetical protein